jgi:hypothetical protein
MRDSPRRQRLEQIDALRVRATTLKKLPLHASIKFAILDVENELDDATESLIQRSVDHRLHIVLPIADSIITNAASRLGTVEHALTINPDAELHSQLAADE